MNSGEAWLIPGIVFLIVGCLGIMALMTNVRYWNGSTVWQRRIVSATITLVSFATAACMFFLYFRTVPEQQAAVQKQREQFVALMAPLVSELDRVGFTSVTHSPFDDPAAYEFTDDTRTSGKVRVANKRGSGIWVRFEITGLGAKVGCLGDDDRLDPVGPGGAETIRGTSGGCL